MAQISKVSASLDVARAAAMSILRCSSRTATGGEAYFALHAILGPLAQAVRAPLRASSRMCGNSMARYAPADMWCNANVATQTIITPSRLGAAPLSISVDPEGGGVVITAENLFDVYRSDDLQTVRAGPVAVMPCSV